MTDANDTNRDDEIDRNTGLTDLPQDVVMEIIDRGNVDELMSLCSTNTLFRNVCNSTSRVRLRQEYKDELQIYTHLKRSEIFRISVVSHEGYVKFAKAKRFENILEQMKEIFRDRALVPRSAFADVSYSLDNEPYPSVVVIHFNHTNSNLPIDFDITIHGFFARRSKVMALLADIAELYDNLNIPNEPVNE